MADVELILKADNKQYIASVQEAQKASESLHKTTKEGTKREIGLIEDLENEIKKLEELKKRAWDEKSLSKYNQKLAEAKRDLQDYNKLGLETKKTTESMSQSILKWVGSLGLAATAINLLKKAFLETQQGIRLLGQGMAALNQITYNMVSGMNAWNDSLGVAVVLAGKMADLKIKDRFETFKAKKLMTEYNELYTEGIDAQITSEEKIQKLTEAKRLYQQAIDVEIASTKEQLRLATELTRIQPLNDKAQEARFVLLNRLQDQQSQRASGIRRLTRQITGEIERQEKENITNRDKRWADEIEAMNEQNAKKWQQEDDYVQKSKELVDAYTKSHIDSLEGVEQLKAQREFGIKQIQILRDQLAALGPITQEQMAMLESLAADVWKAYHDALIEASKNTPEQEAAISKALLEGMPTVEEIQKYKGQTPTSGGTPIESIWQLLGIDEDTDEGQAAIDALKETAQRIATVINDITDARVEETERNRELLDTRIAETQRALELESELMQEGFANNVDAKTKEIEALKALRDKALKEEEKALKAQRQLDTIMQTTSLITASAQTFKAFSALGPAGIPLAIAMIATMFGAFIASKVKASNLTKLEEGGTGTINGMRHSQGGERFLDHVEVEAGEKWGVLSRSATDKFGNTFDNVVSSFNKGEMPDILTPVSNSVYVDNNGSNSRLDKVITEQKTLNKRLSTNTNMMVVGGRKIITTGNKVRIVG